MGTTGTAYEGCWFCHDEIRGGGPAGGWLVDDATWRAGHAPTEMAPLGSVVLETRRHVLDESGFDAQESATCSLVTGRLITAIRAVTGADRVYHWATMDRHPHFHLWLVPWFVDGDLRGPRYLAEALSDRGSGTTPNDVEGMAMRLRQALDRPPYSPTTT